MRIREFDFKNVETKFRPTAFWSLNDNLQPKEMRRQVSLMAKAGLGGFFMHARTGLETEYMSREWFDCLKAAIDEANKAGMYPYAYDENGWPSGISGNHIPQMGEKYQRKILYCIDEKDSIPENGHFIAKVGSHVFYYVCDSYYVDLLDKEVTEIFIKDTYERYKKELGNSFPGFFTDEPQLNFTRHVDWSLCLPKLYEEEYGGDLIKNLPSLFFDDGNDDFREKYHRLLAKTMSENYSKALGDWCKKNGYALVGHFLSEGTLKGQSRSCGCTMMHYEHFTIPGVDLLFRRTQPEQKMTVYQCASVAHQTGKKQVISESFAGSGHNVSFTELKAMYEWQAVRGVNLLCNHLEPYSMRGQRKRDYPPALFYQQPWWNRAGELMETLGRISKILSLGETNFSNLVLHPINYAWSRICQGEDSKDELLNLNNSFEASLAALESKHVLFDLGDMTFMEKHAFVKNGRLTVGLKEYDSVTILPECKRIPAFVQGLLDEFESQGGKIYYGVENVPANDIIDTTKLCYTKRDFEDFSVHYFVNSSEESVTCTVKTGSYILGLKSGKIYDLKNRTVTIPAYESLMVIQTDEKTQSDISQKSELKVLDTSGMWNVSAPDGNILTLDKCKAYIDGECIGDNLYILDVFAKALALAKPVNLRLDFTFDTVFIPSALSLILERPDVWTLKLNGKTVEKQDEGFFADESFRKIALPCSFIKKGENTISLEGSLTQTPEVYKRAANAMVNDQENNTLSYTTEAESIYLLGDFDVETKGSFVPSALRSSVFNGSFVLVPHNRKANAKHLEQSGYPFFCGKLVLEKEFSRSGENCLVLKPNGWNAADIFVNDSFVKTVMWDSDVTDLTRFLVKDTNTVRVELYSTLRNMLGPHHYSEGETTKTWPRVFCYTPNPFGAVDSSMYEPSYCIADFGI